MRIYPFVSKMSSFRSFNTTLTVLQEFKNPEVAGFISLIDKDRILDKGWRDDEHCCSHPFIVLEGLDASGKTTVARTLANCLDGAVMTTPGPRFDHYRSIFDKQSENIRRAYYAFTNYAVGAEIRQTISHKAVILDRFWHSTAAYSFATLDTLPPKGSDVYKWPTDLKPCPQVVIFLHVDEDVRLQRHKLRATTNTEEEKRLAKDKIFRSKLIEIYQNFIDPKVVFINANGTVDAVTNEILQHLQLQKIIR